jgi:predicted phage-related endonuclease
VARLRKELTMVDIKWVDRHIEIEPPKKPKKLTATRLGTILGCNPWSTDFEVWCAVTRTYEKPFEDTIYTVAGKTIEPKQAEYMRRSYMMDNLVTPTDKFGEDYFSKTWGDFFHEEPIFGGMWDYLLEGEDGAPEAVLEMKTTKRSEDWAEDIPEYYAVQAALYAYLLGIEDVIMVASFLEDKDYKNPEKYVPNAKNTITVEFKLHERYPDFEDKIAQATKWWMNHVETGISPDFDEKKDEEILKVLRTNSLAPETDVEALIKEGEALKKEIDEVSNTIVDKEKRLKTINDILKEKAMSQFREGDKKVEIKGQSYVWTVSKSEKTTTKIDEAALKTDGLYEKYSKSETSTTYRMTVGEIKEDK